MSDDDTETINSSASTTSVKKIMAFIGSINEFDPTNDDWECYTERLEQFFLANDVENNKKVNIFLTLIGQNAYSILRDLCQPSKPGSKSYDDLHKLMKNHLNPKPSEMAERYKFQQLRQKSGQSLNDFVVTLQRGAKDCEFENRDISLRDQFVAGISSDNIKKRLFTESALTFKKAVEIAMSMEAAEINTAAFHQPNLTERIAKISVSRPKPSSSGNTCSDSKPSASFNANKNSNNANQGLGRFCYCCGRQNHTTTRCKYLNYSCNQCNQKGHLANMCKNSNQNTSFHSKGKPKKFFRKNKFPNRHNFLEGQGDNGNHYVNQDVNVSDNEPESFPDQNEGGMFHVDINEGKTLFKPLYAEVLVNDKPLKMQIDTGSPISAISSSMYETLFLGTKLYEPNITLKSYNGTLIEPKGYMKVKVSYVNDRLKTLNQHLDLFVIENGSNPLIGRDWLRRLNVTLDFNSLSAEVKLENLLSKYKQLFSEGIGTYNKGKVKLHLKPNTVPVYHKARPVPFSIQDKVDKELERLVNEGILEPVEYSEWGTPIVAIPKNDNSLRICGDFSVTLNPALLADRYPLPRIDNILAKLGGKNFFSKIDLKHAYQQVLLDPESKQYTTISTNKGLFCYTRIPFGITSGPSVFQRIMDQTLKGLNDVYAFQDDLLISGKTEEEHLNNLSQVFQRLSEVGLKVQKQKCEFFKTSICYLGYVIDSNGLHKDESKVKAIMNAPVPNNVSELKGFLGLINFYGSFVKNLASILHPLYNLLSKDVPWSWSEECDKAFCIVKEILASDDVLCHYDSTLPLKLSCDSSSYGVGVVLSHVFPDGEERPIAYSSRVLSKAEKNYSCIEREALSIIFGVRKFDQYLYGRHFVLSTDHKPLLAIFGKKNGIPQVAANRLQRWAYILSSYDYEIEYVKSVDNGNCDGLSRLPLRNVGNDESDYDYLKFVQTTCMPISSKCVKSETKKDPILSKVLGYVMFGWPSRVESNELLPYESHKNELNVEDECLMWGYRIVIPLSLRETLLTELHLSHLGIVKMKSIARATFWWPGIDKDIENVANSCQSCCEVRPNPEKLYLHNWNIPSKAWERIHIDFFGPVLNKMYMIVIDAYSKFIEIVQMKDTTSHTTVVELRKIFARYGLPVMLVSDNGPQLTSDEFSIFMKSNGIKHCFTAPYHPATNGAAENAVKSVKKSIKIAVKFHVDVELAIDRFLFDYRISKHCTTCLSPSELMFGRKIRSRFDLLRPNFRENVQSKQLDQAKNHKGKRKVQFFENQVVLARMYSQNRKWVLTKVVKVISDVSYLVQTFGENAFVFKRHANQLLQYSGDNLYNKSLSVPQSTTQSESQGSVTEPLPVSPVQSRPVPVVSPKASSNASLTSPVVDTVSRPSNVKPCSPDHSLSPQNRSIVKPELQGTPMPRRYPERARKKKQILDL